MIIKSFEINKINSNKNNLILLYGKNDGLKKYIINKLVKKQSKILSYEEKEILDEQNNFLETILNKSLFEEQKTIIIKRATDKILIILEEIFSKNIDDIIIILSENLEKKSKLRITFEKEKKLVCIPIYQDNEQTLSKLALDYFKEKNIPISQSNINQIVGKSLGDRANLFSEIKKIENYTSNGKKITSEKLAKLINLSENHNISELIDNCLAKNNRKIINIINENNFSRDDSVLITRIFINKCKRILKLSSEYKKNNNIDLTISTAKPPIFWKDKDIIKQQIFHWSPENIKQLIYKLSDLELSIKKNLDNSVNLIIDFILVQASSKTNN